MYSCGPLHMDEQRHDDQLEPTYSSSAPIRNVTLNTCRKQWTIGRGSERGSEISVLMVRRDDDDDDDVHEVVDFFMRFMKPVFACAFPKFVIEFIIAITNSNCDSVSLRKIPHCIYTSVKTFYSCCQFDSPVLHVIFDKLTSPDILYIFRQSIIQLWVTIPYVVNPYHS